MKQLLKIGLVLTLILVFTGCKKQDDIDTTLEVNSYIQEKEVYSLENDNLKFTLDPKTTFFEVLDKKNNTVWNSNPLDSDNDPQADAQRKKYLKSTLLIEYTNQIGISALFNNFELSVDKQIYTIEEIDNGIKVNYSIGDVDKVFVLPPAMSESRFNEFSVNMSDKDIRQINSYYRKLDINNLRVSDDKNALLEQYPDLANEMVYVIRDNVQEYLLVKIQDIFEAAGYNYDDYLEDSEKYAKSGDNNKPLFNISVIYRLEGEDLVVELPYEDMEWKEDYPLTKVKVLPYFGAASTVDEGYLLVPEGNGGIIGFNNGKIAQNAYYSEVYGWDDAEKRDALIDDSTSEYPVFGISKNGSSMLCILEDKQSNAFIEADISGRGHSYNYVNAGYVTLHSAFVDVSAKTDRSVLVFEAKKPTGSIKQRYKFIASDSYVDMASTYRDYLMTNNDSLTKKEESNTPVEITILGAIDHIRQKFGFPVSTPIPLTTYKEAAELVNELGDMNFKNLSLKYRGWMNDGVKQKPLEKVKIISELGNKKDLDNFLNTAKKEDIKVYLEGMTHYAYNYNWFDGFEINQDSSKHASREVVKLYSFSPIYYGTEEWKDSFYLVKPQLNMKYMENLYQFAKDNKAYGVAFTDVGRLLGSDFNPKNLTTREEVRMMQENKLNELSSDAGIMVQKGNAYVLPYVDFISDMNLHGKKYHIIDELVPFYTIALHGVIDYSGPSLNLSNDSVKTILQSAETGAGLSFTFMKESSFTLQESNYTYFYASDFDLWKTDAAQIYKRYNNELGHIFNQYITDHEVLAEGLYVTTYEDGTKVYVNYNEVDKVLGDVSIPARDYKVIRR